MVRGSRPPIATLILAVATGSLLLLPSLASAQAIGGTVTALCANIVETPSYPLISEQGGKDDSLCW